MCELGRSEGIDFQFDKIVRSTNTFESHRMVYFAHAHGLQDKMVEALFSAYFTEGLFWWGDHAVLIALAERVGLDGEQARIFFQSTDAIEALKTDEAQIRSIGTDSIPLSGLQSKDAFLRFIDQGVAA
jgi:predicted DsbA family dithiol-disulfide isomerase